MMIGNGNVSGKWKETTKWHLVQCGLQGPALIPEGISMEGFPYFPQDGLVETERRLVAGFLSNSRGEAEKTRENDQLSF